jgi:hypothetical protein
MPSGRVDSSLPSFSVRVECLRSGFLIDLGLAGCPATWHSYGMVRIRVSTTVDQTLLENARRLRSDLKDAALLDEALSALAGQHRAAEIAAGYAAYDDHPLDEADEWGDLASFREAAASS